MSSQKTNSIRNESAATSPLHRAHEHQDEREEAALVDDALSGTRRHRGRSIVPMPVISSAKVQRADVRIPGEIDAEDRDPGEPAGDALPPTLPERSRGSGKTGTNGTSDSTQAAFVGHGPRQGNGANGLLPETGRREPEM